METPTQLNSTSPVDYTHLNILLSLFNTHVPGLPVHYEITVSTFFKLAHAQ